MMRVAAVALLLCTPAVPAALAAPAAQANAEIEARMAKARTIVEKTMPAEQRDAMFRQMLDAMMANMMSGMMQGDPRIARTLESNAEAAKLFASFVDRQKKLVLDDLREHAPGMIEAVAGAYAKRFSLAELTEIEAFARTPTGSRFLQTGMQIFSDPGVAEWQRDFTARVQGRQAGELRRLMEELAPILEKQNVQPSKS